MNKCVSGKETLDLFWRFEPLHLAFSTSVWPMRVFRAVIQIATLSVFNFWKHLALCHPVAWQLVDNNHARYILKTFQQPSEEPLRGFGVPSRLNEDVEYDTVLIHRAPKIVLHSSDPDEHLIEMPLVAGPWTAAAQTVGKGLAELLAPTPNRLVGEDHAPFRQKQLNPAG